MATDVPPRRGRGRNTARWLALAAAVLLATLFLPEPAPEAPPLPGRRPFVWGRDDLWRSLETRFDAARLAGCPAVRLQVERLFQLGDEQLARLAGRPWPADAPLLGELEATLISLGPDVAACPEHLAGYIRFADRLRSEVMEQAGGWDLTDQSARDRAYRLLYGARAAVEEALLQAPAGAVPALVRGDDEPSATPAATMLGISVHSGDLLVSRGGAPTSALIARGSDYPGNFSHVALAAVEDGALAIVEAHIERGVAVASLDDYLRDTKLRILVLRPRADLPVLRADPLVPHRAAMRALDAARRHHIAYDFAMDWRDHDRLFCSEIASAAYEAEGVTLWSALSTISSPGLAAWLAGFGVRNLVTQEPSDLELDPQLRVVAEWRDPEVLFRDHVDNAAIDALLEQAEAGRRLPVSLTMLPLARLAKAYSAVLNALGRVGPVPEGMSAATALRARALDGLHAALAAEVLRRAEAFRTAHGYRPPYWQLVRIAREAGASIR